MSWGDIFHYVTLGNPISQAVLSSGSAVLKAGGLKPKQLTQQVPLPPPIPSLWEISGTHYQFIRLAGLSGATAIILSGYRKHILGTVNDPLNKMEIKSIFDTAHRFHFLHSFALLAIPLVRRPVLTGSLMATGTILFSGPMYYRAITGDITFVQVSTIGGFCLIAAWLSLIF